MNFDVDVNVKTTGKKEVDELEQAINRIKNSQVNVNVNLTGKGANFASYLGNLQKQAQTAGQNIGKSLQQGINKIGTSSINSGNINSFVQKQIESINQIKDNAIKVSQEVNQNLNKNAFGKGISNEAKNISNSISKQFDSYSKSVDRVNERLEKLRSNVSNSDFSKKYENTTNYKNIESNLTRIAELENKINTETSQTSPDLNKINSDLKEMTSLLSKSENAFNNLTKPIATLDAQIASNKTLKWLNENTKAAKAMGDEFKSIAELQAKAITDGELQSANKLFNSKVAEAQAKGLTGKSWTDEFKRAFTQIAEFTGMYGVLQNVMQDLPRELVKNVADVDDAMTNLRMATSVSNTEAQNLMKTYSEMGRELKVLGTDVATSSTEWLKQGKSIQEADALTRNSIILSKIGDLSSEEATKTITAAMKSYDLNINEVMGFVDQISAIDMASATDVGGLSQAFNEVAANAKQAGIETNQLLSYAAVIGETTQEGMSSVGTSLNAIISRMGNIKLSRLKDFETGEDLSNVETVLKKVGISLRDSSGQFREFDDVLDDTASKWENFDSVTQRAVANAFAGTHHANDFMILMQQYDQAREYMQIADQSSGESIQKFTAYQESLAGAVEGFKNSVQGLSTSVVSGDFLTGIVDAGTGALDVITKLTDQFGTLGMIASGIGIFQGFKNGGKSIYGIRPYTFFKMTYAT